jgi:hypothetical protein
MLDWRDFTCSFRALGGRADQESAGLSTAVRATWPKLISGSAWKLWERSRGAVVDDTGWSKAISGGDQADRTDGTGRGLVIQAGEADFGVGMKTARTIGGRDRRRYRGAGPKRGSCRLLRERSHGGRAAGKGAKFDLRTSKLERNVTNEPNLHQVAGLAQLGLKYDVESKNQNEWALDNVDGFYERTHL